MNNFNFTDRTTYLISKAEWAANYAQLVLDIRAAKNAIKNSNRNLNGGRNIGDVWSSYAALRSLHNDLREALDQRAGAKVEAQRQYLAERQVAA